MNENNIENQIKSIYDQVIDIFDVKPLKVIDLLSNIKKRANGIQDELFFEKLKAFINSLLEGNEATLDESILKDLQERLAEVVPSDESGYLGEPERLREYGRRIIKLINDCDTLEKATYLANLTRAFASKKITVRDYFKLGRCISSLTSEDLEIIRNKISEESYNDDVDYYEDFQSLGLMSLRAGGYKYTNRAFLLRNYGLKYEGEYVWPSGYISGKPEDFSAMWEEKTIVPIPKTEVESWLTNNNEPW